MKLATVATGVALPAADATGNINLSASAGKVALVNGTAGLTCNGSSTACSAAQQALILDLVGYGSGTNFFEGSAAAPAPSATTALLRKNGGCTDSHVNSVDFSTGTPAPRNSVSAAAVCRDGGSRGDTPAPTFRRTYEIQGGGDTSPFAGQSVTTQGVVTKLTNTGYFIQDLTGDGNPATSDGLYVFTGTAPGVSVGPLVQLSGTVTEFTAGSGSVLQAGNFAF